MEKNYGIFVCLLSLIFLLGCVQPDDSGPQAVKELPRFSSCSALSEAFEKSQDRGYFRGLEEFAVPMMAVDAQAVSGEGGKSAPDYSETNIQVAGVDEADIVKTDGEYIYVVSNGRLHIVEAYPAEDAELLSSTDLDEVEPVEIFIDDDMVMVFGRLYKHYDREEPVPMYYPRYGSLTVMQLWDVSDREDPELVRSIEFEGDYLSSRKIDSTAYFVLRKYQYDIPECPDCVVPLYRDVAGPPEEEDYAPVAGCNEVSYLPPMHADSFVIVGAVSMSDPDAEITKEVVVGSGQNIYASMENLYIAEVDYRPIFFDVLPWEYEYEEKTVIHKFSLSEMDVSYEGSMNASGSILNQFSMDEHDGYFRIATTTGHVSRSGGPTSENNIYTFDSDLELKGELEGLAPGERIYSARFMGDRAYLVTFKKVDPLFVIDLEDPENPEILGKLKIPGYSDYLHPIDEDHIIGIGKETVEAEEGDFAWYQGVKMAVFDVSDVEKPKEMHKVVIGDRGTDSYALHDHKAFLYDKKKDLLVVPVLLAEIDWEQYGENIPPYTHGDYVFQGAFVYDLTLEDGFDLRGRITHMEEKEFDKYGYYYYDYGYSVKRSMYIDDVLYTVSDAKVKANSLDDLEMISEIELPGMEDY